MLGGAFQMAWSAIEAGSVMATARVAEILDPFADLHDMTGKFMAADDRHIVRAFGQHARYVGPANTDGGDAQQNFALLCPGPRDRFEAYVARRMHDGCLHFFFLF
jgi:hypothetical protein